ncbi:acyltransferase family protein [Methylomonas sp. UP202]|uniref:acyltransferase family protein n=1 Tax=Methylomonas sp. UP202 TaxID=3040943 RepID=UPI00143B6907|nr:acyltransferase family protein [Methylomonas sp. UP202]NJA08268.1 acyltransferase [Methylococcaceae bacterium WWC4]WGS86483.1 acyltransferase family protein [Methylomonas sp. UP202]
MHKQTHISYLDTIRGLAALTVVSEHYVIAYGLPCQTPLCEQILDFSPLHFWWEGSAAVSMFFVLSGLVLSLKYFQHGHMPDLTRFDLTRFLIGRVFRIWFPYLLVLGLSAGLFNHTFGRPVPVTALAPTDWIVDMWHKFPLDASAMVREGFLLDMPDLIVLLPQSWTLGVELVLSLLLPVGLLLVDRGTSWVVFFSVLAIALLGVSAFLLHFLLGLTIARYLPTIKAYLVGSPALRRFLLGVGGLFYTGATLLPKPWIAWSDGQLVWLGTGLGAGMILLFVLASVRVQAILSKASLRQIGKVSYSTYLIHMAVLICLTPYVLMGLQAFSENRLFLWLGGWLLTMLIVQGLALLCYRLVEIPSIVVGRWLADRVVLARH